MDSTTLHEPVECLPADTLDMHRALVSLMEELQAIDSYRQRVDATQDPRLKEVLGHNKNEEIEHASMLLEWIRRRSVPFDQNLRRYLFSEAPIVGIEASVPAEGADAPAVKVLGIGSMKKER